MSHRDAYLSEKAEKDAERKADEKYEKESVNSPSAYLEWFMTTEEYKNYQGRLVACNESIRSPRLQTYQGSSGENGSASVPR